MKLLFVSARSATVLLDGSGDYSLPVPVSLSLNGADLGEEKRSVISLFGLLPDSEYTLSMRQGQTGEQMTFRTEPESFTLDVRRFGAAGDGVTDERIYEHYRALADLFRAGVFRAPREQLLSSPAWTSVTEKGIRLGLLPEDLYGADRPVPHVGVPVLSSGKGGSCP